MKETEESKETKGAKDSKQAKEKIYVILKICTNDPMKN
jgi:hypothetical protein